MVQVSRRIFMAGSAAIVAACSAPLRQEKADVVVIGAGLSGLHTASLLRSAGMKVIVLEASNRAGGRVQTIDTDEGPLDVGASQIGRSYARVIDACRRHNLNLVPEDRDLLEFGTHFKGQWIESKGWADNPLNKCVGDERQVPPMLMGRHVVQKSNPLSHPQEWLDPKFADFDISLADFMRREGASAQALELARFSVPGISMEQTSLLRMYQETSRAALDLKIGADLEAKVEADAQHPFGEVNVRSQSDELARISNIEGGCSELPKAMAKTLGDDVRFGKTASRITLSKTSGMVECADGSVYGASFVVSALPFSILRNVSIEGPASPANQKAIAQMPYANTARMYLTVDEPFWEKDGLPASFSTDGPMGMFWTIDNQRSSGPQRAMIVLVGEAGEAIGKMDNAQAEAFINAQMKELRPASDGKLRRIAYKDWQADPLQRGCSFSMNAGQVGGFGRDMRKPWGVLHFAGEHMRELDFGMEAAMESAERVAANILQA